MLPLEFINALKQLTERLANRNIDWVLTGSTSFIIRGIPLKPNDIDILTDKDGSYEIEKCFSDNVKKRVSFIDSDKMRSHTVILELEGVSVEIMCDIKKKVNGAWEDPVDIKKNREFIRYLDLDLPVLNMVYEYESYLKMGRYEKADLLKNGWKRIDATAAAGSAGIPSASCRIPL